MYSNQTTSTAVLFCGAVAVIAAGLGATGPARAETITRTERVFVGDLDLTAESGRTTAMTRVEGAVVRVCARPEGPVAYVRRAVRNCERVARSGAKHQMSRLVERAHERAYARAD